MKDMTIVRPRSEAPADVKGGFQRTVRVMVPAPRTGKLALWQSVGISWECTMAGDAPSAIVPVPEEAPVVVTKVTTSGNGGFEITRIYK